MSTIHLSFSLYLVTDDLFYVHLYVTFRSVIKEQEGRAKIDKLEKLMVRIDCPPYNADNVVKVVEILTELTMLKVLTKFAMLTTLTMLTMLTGLTM